MFLCHTMYDVYKSDNNITIFQGSDGKKKWPQGGRLASYPAPVAQFIWQVHTS